MRKFLKLFGMFFHKNMVKTIALLVVFVSMCIIVSTTLASYSYYFKSISFYQKDEIINSDYIQIYNKFSEIWQFNMMATQEPEDGSYGLEVFNKVYRKLVDSDVYGQIEEFPAVDDVYSYTVCETGYNLYNDVSFKMLCAEKATYQLFDYSLSNGNWFWDTTESSIYPNVVLCGTLFENVDVGNDIDITLNNKHYMVHVIGKVAAPYRVIRFDSSERHTYESLETTGNTIFVLNDKKTVNYFGEQILYYPDDAIVVYKSDATEKEIADCRAFYESYFTNENSYFDFDIEEFMEEYGEVFAEVKTFEPTTDKVKKSFDIMTEDFFDNLFESLLLVLISTFMLVALSMLLVRTKQRDYSIYYLCGCSKRKTFLISLAGIASIAVVAGLICTGYMIWKTYIISQGLFMGGEYRYIFDIPVYLGVWGYLALCVLVSCIIPFRMIFSKKSSLISLYRKGKE